MQTAHLEHINMTVSNPKATADMYCQLFGWHIRWEGDAMDNGYTIHVGTDTHYIALYRTGTPEKNPLEIHKTIGGLTHIAVTVEDAAAMEASVKAAGFIPQLHYNRAENSGFYFDDHDGIEYEVVCYARDS